jgi:L-malate glycosyltransferase
MKICFFANGKSIHTERWCKHFHSLGHEIHLITFANAEISSTCVHYINAGNMRVEGGNWKFVFAVGKIKKILREIKPDILHSHYATSYGFSGALCNFHPYVVTALGSDVLVSPDHSFIYRKVLKYIFRKADWITAMSDPMRNKMLKLGADELKTDTVIFGIDTSVFNMNDRKLPDDKFVITSTRNFEPVYNIKHLVESVAKIKDQIPNLFLNLVSVGSQREEIEALVQQKGLSAMVKFWGWRSQKEVAEILKSSHIFASVSLSDGNNISLNDAMACGDLCIVTDIPANRVWIENEKNGFIVPVNDIDDLAEKILKAYNNYDALSSRFIPMNEKLISEKADWKKNMQKVEQKYFELCKQR